MKAFKASYLILLLFVIACIFYLNVNKLPLTHPGNIKAADPFYHVMAVEGIIDTEQYNYYDYYISLGQEKAVSVQPPLFYMNSAILTLFSDVPSWVTLYFLICLAQGFFVVLVFLITKEIFNEESAILASLASILPIPLNVWLYGLYIGLWIQVAAYFFVLLFLWLFIRYIKYDDSWTLIFMGICISSIILLHPQDLLILSFPVLVIAFRWLKKIDLHTIKEIVKLGIIPGIVLISLLPRFLFIWRAHASDSYSLGFYGLPEIYFSRVYSGGLVSPDLFFMPSLVLLLFVLGLIHMVVNRQKYRLWLITNAYYFFLTYVTPIILKDPYYLMRARSFTPFLIYPTIAFVIDYYFIKKLNNKNWKLGTIFAVGSLIILISLPTYFTLADSLQKSEHLSYGEWKAYKWIQDNTPKTAKVLFLGGVFQSENIFSKRVSAAVGINDIQTTLQSYFVSNITPLNFNAGWGGNTMRDVYLYEISTFEYGKYFEPDSKVSVLDFDYILFQNIPIYLFDNPPITLVDANNLFIGLYTGEYRFRLVYNQEGYLIIKNEKAD